MPRGDETTGSWSDATVVVTGGASFIGSHLVEALATRGAVVRVVDDLSSGRLENIADLVDEGAVAFDRADLLDAAVGERLFAGADVVFHLAAAHGGRGFIDSHQVECSTNMVLDGTVFRAAERAGVRKVVFASSACVYPQTLQAEGRTITNLAEAMVGPPFDADNLYGWAKLMGELTLRAYCAEGRLEGASLRYFTAYGPRCSENHAVMAMIARAMTDQDPFVIWGNGEQVRNWTHVSDIVEGTIRGAERIVDGSAVNVGTTEQTRVVDCAREILRHMGKDVEFDFDLSKPTGPFNRIADDTLARDVLGWTPQVSFLDGLHRTIDWYVETHDVSVVRDSLEHLLLERSSSR
jgi:nucleoside-diphosphate-sugar epimerase